MMNKQNETKLSKIQALYSPKVFFGSTKPTSLTMVSGNPQFEEQKRYVLSKEYEIRKTKKYPDDDSLIDGETTAPHHLVQDISPLKIDETLDKILLQRLDAVAALSHDWRSLFVYGGRSGSTQHDSLIRYDFMNKHMVVYSQLELISHCKNATVQTVIPPLSNTEMVSVGNRLYLFGGTHQLSNTLDLEITHAHFGQWYVNRPSNSYNHNEMVIMVIDGVFGTNVYNGVPLKRVAEFTLSEEHLTSTERAFPIREIDSVIVPCRSHFSLATISKENGKVEAYLFGGKKNSVMDDFFVYTFSPEGSTFEVKQITKPTIQDVVWPSARFGHSACMVANSMYVFGGSDSNGKVLHDLFKFDFNTREWTEIIPISDSLSPPSLFKHYSYSVDSESLFVGGGQVNVDTNLIPPKISSQMFKFDVLGNKWSKIK